MPKKTQTTRRRPPTLDSGAAGAGRGGGALRGGRAPRRRPSAGKCAGERGRRRTPRPHAHSDKAPPRTQSAAFFFPLTVVSSSFCGTACLFLRPREKPVETPPSPSSAAHATHHKKRRPRQTDPTTTATKTILCAARPNLTRNSHGGRQPSPPFFNTQDHDIPPLETPPTQSTVKRGRGPRQCFGFGAPRTATLS